MQGGARGQNAIIPMNLLNENKKCDHVVTGFWSRISASEARKYADVWVANKISTTGLKSIQSLSKWEVRSDSSYVHVCANETVDGIEFLTFAKIKLPIDLTVGIPISLKQSSK